jgi:WD40 repeat protein
VVSGSWDKTLRVWDVDTGDCERVLRGHRDVSEIISSSLHLPSISHLSSGGLLSLCDVGWSLSGLRRS